MRSGECAPCMSLFASPLYALGRRIYDLVRQIAVRADEERWEKGGSITCPHIFRMPPVFQDVHQVELLNWHLLLCDDCNRGIEAFRMRHDW